MLPVSVAEGTAQPAADEWEPALRALAGAIRQGVAAFRARPVRAEFSGRGGGLPASSPPNACTAWAPASLHSSPPPAAHPALRCVQEEQLLAMAEAEAFVAAPLPRLLAHLARRFLPLLTATTNYVPVEQVGRWDAAEWRCGRE